MLQLAAVFDARGCMCCPGTAGARALAAPFIAIAGEDNTLEHLHPGAHMVRCNMQCRACPVPMNGCRTCLTKHVHLHRLRTLNTCCVFGQCIPQKKVPTTSGSFRDFLRGYFDELLAARPAPL